MGDVAIPDITKALPGPKTSRAILAASNAGTAISNAGTAISNAAKTAAAAATPSSAWSVIKYGGLLILALGIVSVSLGMTIFTGNSSNITIIVGAVAISVGALFFLSQTFVGESIKNVFSGVGLGGNAGAIGLILTVSIIAFVLVFIPAITKTSPSSDPYLGALIGVIFSIVGVLVLVYLYNKSSQFVAADVISRISRILYYFLPYALFTFGPLVDIITQKLQFLPATVVGLSSIFINWSLATVLSGGNAPVSKSGGCEIPGLAFFSSNLVPQPMMATLSMLAYIATYLSRSTLSGAGRDLSISFTNDPNMIWPPWLLYGIVAGAYAGAFISNECLTWKGVIPAILAPAVYGGIFGILGFEFLAPRYDPTAPAASRPILGPGGTRRCPDGSAPGLDGTCGSSVSAVGTCSAGSNDGEFICESFENGKLKTQIMTE